LKLDRPNIKHCKECRLKHGKRRRCEP